MAKKKSKKKVASRKTTQSKARGKVKKTVKKRTASSAKQKRSTVSRKPRIRKILIPKGNTTTSPVKESVGVSAALVFGGLVFIALVTLMIWGAQRATQVEQPTDISRPYLEEFVQSEKLSFGDRVDFWSNFISNLSQSGEGFAQFGAGPEIEDNAPLIPEKFNCTTFVETAAALAESHGMNEFYNHLVAIRYRDSKPTFENRNHFPTLDWIPNNVKAGFLTDITKTTAYKARVKVGTQVKKYFRDRWLSRQIREGVVSRKIASVVENRWKAPVEAALDYISLDDVIRTVEHIPNGAVVNIVRKSRDTQDVLVSHQGLLIKKEDQVFLRHANKDGKIATSPLEEYLNKQKRYKRWPVVGVNINVFGKASYPGNMRGLDRFL